MLRIAIAVGGIGLLACASAPRGPSDAEVQATLAAHVERLETAVLAADVSTTTSHFAPDGQLILNNVLGPEGALTVEVTGSAQIASFLGQVGAPPEFWMEVRGFSRTGDRAEQTGAWQIAGEQTGTFLLNWTHTADGSWRITRWRLDGN